MAPPTQDGPIVVEGSRLSPLQYRWLFSDLREAIGAGDEATALWHYHHCGVQEMQTGLRPSDPDRLAKLELQALSPSLPHLPPSDFFRLHSGNGSTLDIIFTFTFTPPGEFNFVEFMGENTTLLLNTSQNDFYQRGIPGVTRSIDETAVWLKKVAHTLGAERVRTFGASMGGYAALLFAALLDADAAYAAAPLIVLGEEGCRSLTWNDVKTYDPVYRSIEHMLPRLGSKAYIVFPVFNLFEYRQIRSVLACGDVQPRFINAFHPGAMGLDWKKIMQSPEPVSFLDDITFGRISEGVTPETVSLAMKADEALRAKELTCAAAALDRLVEINPSNAGFRYFLGAVSLASGERERAAALLESFADAEPSFSLDLPRDAFLSRWKSRVLEDFSHVLSATTQRDLLAVARALWDARKAR